MTECTAGPNSTQGPGSPVAAYSRTVRITPSSTLRVMFMATVLVYAAAGRGPEAAKRARALELIDEIDFGLSAQVLQEFYIAVVRKVEAPLSPARRSSGSNNSRPFPASRSTRASSSSASRSAGVTASATGTAPSSRGGGAGRPHPVHRRPEPRPDLRLSTRDEPFLGTINPQSRP